MINCTESLKILKTESQRILDFSVLICYAIPGLKKLIRGYKEKIEHFDKFHKPDYFKEKVDINRLSAVSNNYKSNLSKYILISAFSFFEAYIKNVIEELIEFHGGKEEMIKFSLQRRNSHLNQTNLGIVKNKRKIQEPFKKKNWQKYQKYQSNLENENRFRFPSELISPIGMKYLIEIIQGKNFRSALIPEILEIGLGLDLTEKINKHEDIKDKDLKETFEIIRDWRNLIGHGTSGDLGLLKTMDMIRFLRYLAVKTDKHLIENFFILERT